MGFTVAYITEAINKFGVYEACVILKADLEDVLEFQRLFMGVKVGRPETRLDVEDDQLARDYKAMGLEGTARQYHTSTRVIVRELDRRGIERRRH